MPASSLAFPRFAVKAVLLPLIFTALAVLSAGAQDYRPDPASVQRYGPAYRFPQAGWIVLHIEGEPYERGYQHGRLLAPEIAAHLHCFAAILGPKAPSEAWNHTRRLTNALFVRRFDKEFLEEMKGIADGATAAGARFDQRPIDLIDIVALNCWPEIETLDTALEATPTGLEGLRFPHPQPRAQPAPRPEHCTRLRRHRPGHRRWQDRLWPYHHVLAVCRQFLQCLDRRETGQGSSLRDVRISGGHAERHGLLHQ